MSVYPPIGISADVLEDQYINLLKAKDARAIRLFEFAEALYNKGSDLEAVTEKIKTLPLSEQAKAWVETGYDKYVKKWISEGLITMADL